MLECSAIKQLNQTEEVATQLVSVTSTFGFVFEKEKLDLFIVLQCTLKQHWWEMYLNLFKMISSN